MYASKVCSKCQVDKPVAEFYVRRNAADGLSYYCVDCQRRITRDVAQRARLRALEILGDKCARCPETDLRVLHVDHVEGGGSKHRQEIGSSPHALLRAVKAEPSRFQLLCPTCNWRKRLDDEEGCTPEMYSRRIPTERKAVPWIPGDKSSQSSTMWKNPEIRRRMVVGIRLAWDNKSDAELEAHAVRISTTKQRQIANGAQLGNTENLKKGWVPEAHAKAVKASADMRRGTKATEETRKRQSDGVKLVYKEGRRVAGIGDKWARKFDVCIKCKTADRPHHANGICHGCRVDNRTENPGKRSVVIPTEIRERYQNGESIARLASELHVSTRRLSKWLRDQESSQAARKTA